MVANGSQWVTTSGAVTSTGTGNYHTEYVRFGGSSDHTTCTSSPCTIEDSSGLWVSNVAWNATGAYTLTFASGEFSKQPACTCIAKDIGVSNTWCQPSDTEPTNTSYSIDTYGVSSGTSTAYNTYVEMICVGPH